MSRIKTLTRTDIKQPTAPVARRAGQHAVGSAMQTEGSDANFVSQLLEEADSDKDILQDRKIFIRPKFVDSKQRTLKFRD